MVVVEFKAELCQGIPEVVEATLEECQATVGRFPLRRGDVLQARWADYCAARVAAEAVLWDAVC